MKSKFGLLILLALAFQAQAAVVSQRQAALAARAWAGSGRVLNTPVAPAVSSARTYSVADGLVFHAVTMSDGRTVFVSGDDALEPVVAFASGTPAPDSPLIDILRRDAYLRAVAAGYFSKAQGASPAKPGTALTAGVAAAGKTVRKPEIARKWAALLPNDEGANAAPPSPKTALGANNVVRESEAADVISDIRVAPLLDSRWSQTETTGGLPCYNYHTPLCEDNFGKPVNAPCGCTATAMSQILRYHRYPEAFPEKKSFVCTIDNVATNLCPLGVSVEETDGVATPVGEPVPYDWDLMDGVPGMFASEDVREAIGHLTYDVGVALKSNYTAGETGANPNDVPAALREFGYPSGYMFYNDAGLEEYYTTGEISEVATAPGLTGDAELRQNTILASLDAKLPVLLGLYGFAKDTDGVKIAQRWAWGGHAVVADGYGITEVDGEETTYVHVNLGWGGSDDAWYNLPEIDTAAAGATVTDASGFDFELLSGAAFNISSDENAKGKELVTGRILDDEGEPVENAAVVASANGVVVAETVTDAKGIYALWLEGGAAYDIEASSGPLSGVAEELVAVSSTVSTRTGLVDRKANVGNRWGVDIVISNPCVRIGDTLFVSLDRALQAAADGDVVEVLDPARLRRDAVLGDGVASLTIVATNADAYASPVECRGGASITIPNGAVVAFSNIVFSSSSTVVNVLAGGKASVSGVASFGDVFSGVPGIVTEDDAGFNLAGELLSGIVLDCAAATKAGQKFGTYSCGTATAKSCAKLVISLRGDDRAGAWHSELVPGAGFLKWEDDAEVAAEVAVASIVLGGGEPVYYRTFDKLFLRDAAAGGTADATLLHDTAALTNAWTLSGAWTLRSAVEGGTLSFGKKAGLSVGADSSLEVSDITLAGAVKTASSVSQFTVASGAALTFGPGANADGFSIGKDRHLVSVAKNATFTMESGASITGCTVAKPGKGTVYLANGATFDFRGGTITGCSAGASGGAVYVDDGATLRVSGDATAIGNTALGGASTGGNPNDVYLAKTANFVLAGSLAGSQGFGIYGTSGLSADGDKFGAVASGVTEREAAEACAIMFNQVDAGLYATADGTSLVWTSERPAPIPVDESEAGASVESGGSTQYYATLDEALRAVTADGATVTLLRDSELTEDTVLGHDVSIVGGGHEVSRAGDELITLDGKALTLQDVVFSGGTGKLFSLTNAAALTLGDGAKIIDVVCGSGAAPVTVWGGTFTMESGSEISGCTNPQRRPTGGAVLAGAVSASSSTVESEIRLNGGTITGCSSSYAGGVYVGVKSKVFIKGDATVAGNTLLGGTKECNVLVQDLSSLELAGELTGSVGVTEGVNASTNEFGKATFGGDVQASAHRFTHDTDGDVGVAVKNGSTTLLVWGSALDENGNYTDEDGTVYTLVDGADAEIDLPSALPLVYDGGEQTGVPEGAGYTVSGNKATNAGTYEATVSLRPGFAWSDGGDATRTVAWEIRKADYVLEGVTFKDEEYYYGTNRVHKGVVGLPDCLKVEYENREREEVGTSIVVATITGVFTASGEKDPNYNDFTESMAALLTILPTRSIVQAPDDPVDPGETTVVTPTPIAFKSITKTDAGWTLVVADVVEYCNYRLLYTDDLANGFEVLPGYDWAPADHSGEWIVEIAGPGDARFWKAEGKDGEKPQDGDGGDDAGADGE